MRAMPTTPGDILAAELDADGLKCGHVCAGHGAGRANELACERAADHAGATVMTDLHAARSGAILVTFACVCEAPDGN